MECQYRLHEHHGKATPNVVYAQLKYMWARPDSKEKTLEFLRTFSTQLAHDLQQETDDSPHHRIGSSASRSKLTELSKLLARCYLKQGQWQAQLNDSWSSVSEKKFFFFLFEWSDRFYREIQKIFYIPTFSPLITILNGIKPGIPGHSPILKSLVN